MAGSVTQNNENQQSDVDGLSFTGKIWRARAKSTPVHHQLAESLGLSGDLFAPLLASRELTNEEEAQQFLQPRLANLADPSGLTDMEKAVERTIEALNKGEKIAVFGDYDVDGATSSALMRCYFRALDRPIRVYIPDRMREGYGPNAEAMRLLADEGITLVITVDCGITAHEAVDAANAVGLDVIVTDHHQESDRGLPNAVAVVNPNRANEPFPHKNLAGVGVAFYFVMALNRALREHAWFKVSKCREPSLKALLDLVALGSIADVVKLVGINRPLVAAGLREISATKKPGLQALMKRSGIDPAELGGTQVAFQLAPRINASGRLGNSRLGCELLSTEDWQRAEEITEELETVNQERRRVEQRILKEAIACLDAQDWQDRRGLVVSGEGWHPGVIGIVASRLVERCWRPVVVIAIDEEGVGKGSARSIPGVDLFSALQKTDSCLTQFGGHPAAAGLSLDVAKHLATFIDAFDEAIREVSEPKDFIPVMTIDSQVPVAQLDRRGVDALNCLQPFGHGNPEPVFVVEKVRLVETRVLKDRHIRCVMVDPQGYALDGIAFGCLPGPLGEGLLHPPGEVDVAGEVSINRFRDRETVQMIIRDVRSSEAS
ncbi:single-stranded-DNA-specific exonuclease RecJ [Magnetococcales bacterium HHB-1]